MRKIDLPPDIPGKLFLFRMPGRGRDIDADFNDMQTSNIDRIVCLAEKKEIQNKSPEYLKRLKNGLLPFSVKYFPIADYQTPDDKSGFVELIEYIASSLKKGERILIHCGAGVGRTGMVAICVLLRLGLNKDGAVRLVDHAGSGPENAGQKEFIQWFKKRMEQH